MKPQTYVRKFSVGGLCFTMTLYPNAVLYGWNRRPTKEQMATILPEYLELKREALQAFANETGTRILELVQAGPNQLMQREFKPEGTP